jgi:hypothetical protein
MPAPTSALMLLFLGEFVLASLPVSLLEEFEEAGMAFAPAGMTIMEKAAVVATTDVYNILDIFISISVLFNEQCYEKPVINNRENIKMLLERN